jgi:hypothetical protein
MPHLELDSFDTIAPWQALDAGLAPSAEIALSIEGSGHPFAATPASLEVSIDAAAAGHRIRRAIGPVDLSSYSRLHFWFRSESLLQGLPSDPLRVRLKLGSATLPLDTMGNSWRRYLAGQRLPGWQFVAVGLGDLPPSIRAAVTQVEFEVVQTGAMDHRLWLDALLAAEPRMTPDVDQALIERLDGALIIGGSPVAARLAPASALQPYIRISQFGARRALDRDPVGFRRRERDDQGFLSWPAPEAWDLSYRFDPVATPRSDHAAILDFFGDRLGRGWLPVGNRAFRIEKADQVLLGDSALPLPPMRYVISAYAEPGAPVRDVPVTDPRTRFDLQPAGA